MKSVEMGKGAQSSVIELGCIKRVQFVQMTRGYRFYGGKGIEEESKG